MLNISKFKTAVLTFLLAYGVVFSSTSQAEKRELPPVAEQFLNGLFQGFGLSKGTILFKEKEVKNCETILKNLVYNGKRDRVHIDRLIITNYEKPAFGVVIDNFTLKSVGYLKISQWTIAVGDNYITFTFQNLKSFNRFKTLIYEAPEAFLTIFLGKNAISLTNKGIFYLPFLGKNYRYMSIESGLYTDSLQKRGMATISTTYEGLISLDISISLANIPPDLIQDLKGLVYNPSKKNLLVQKLVKVTPQKLLLMVYFGKDLKRRIANFKQLINTYSGQKGIIGNFAKALKDVLNGKADGIKIEIYNKLELNIGQLKQLISLLMLSNDAQQVENLLNAYFDIKISTF